MAKKKDIVLTDRDREILGTLYHLRIMTTGQVHRLFFNNLRYTQRRLSELVNDKFLKQDNFSTQFNRQENRYSLTTKSIEMAAREVLESLCDKDGKRAYYSVAQNYVNEKQQLHQLMINEIFVRLWDHEVFEGFGSVSEVLKNVWMETRRAIFRSNQAWVKPDAYFDYQGVRFWVEVDRGTESISQIGAKFKRYAELKFQGALSKKNIILFFCENSERLRDETFRSRITDIRKKALEKLGAYIDADFDIYIDEYEALSQTLLDYLVPMVQKKKYEAVLYLANELKQLVTEQGWEARINNKVNPVKSHDFKPGCWLIYKDHDINVWRMIESLEYKPLSVYKRLKSFYSYYYAFESESKGMKPYGLILGETRHDLAEINKIYPELRKVAYFTTRELWEKNRDFYVWDRGKLQGEGVLC